MSYTERTFGIIFSVIKRNLLAYYANILDPPEKQVYRSVVYFGVMLEIQNAAARLVTLSDTLSRKHDLITPS